MSENKASYNSSNQRVVSPNHYQLNINGVDVEAKDIVKAVLDGHEGYVAWCLGDVLTYLIRAGKKDDMVQDFKKAKQFLGFIIDYIDNEVLENIKDVNPDIKGS